MKKFISVVEARSIILGVMAALPSERVAWTEALGRTLAQPIRSRDNIPPFDNSAMDGYAVRTDDLRTLPATLRYPFARRWFRWLMLAATRPISSSLLA